MKEPYKIIWNVGGVALKTYPSSVIQSIGAAATEGLWQGGQGILPYDNYEIRDDYGTLMNKETPLGEWTNGHTFFVNRLAGVGA